jgi:Fic family protein
MKYIYEIAEWPHFTWEKSAQDILTLLGKTRKAQGMLLGKMQNLGFELRQEAMFENLCLDVLKTSEIEGEYLQLNQVRSSLARRLGIENVGLVPIDRNVEGIVEILLDATQNNENPLTQERLFDWQAALFPTGRSGIFRITTGDWRKDELGSMQVVSGGLGKEKVHFQAPAATQLTSEMDDFIFWFNQELNLDTIIKAAIAHLWFITIHPFDDGNGRIARALTDLLLSRSDGSKLRFYSMSAQITLERKQYYQILEQTQKGTLDISDWLLWFLECLLKAIENTEKNLEKVLFKANFWKKTASFSLNTRQKLILNRLLDEWEGLLTSSKYAKISKCSSDTALRDIQDLVEKGILRKEQAGGRSTGYSLLVES